MKSSLTLLAALTMLAASAHASPKPLYRWSKDQKPGDTTGDGFKNLWRVGRP